MKQGRWPYLGVMTLAIVALVCHSTWSQEPESRAPTPTIASDEATTESAAAEGSKGDTTAAGDTGDYNRKVVRPLIILAIGIATVLVLIIVLKINAFIALITAAMLVSVLAVGMLGEGSWAGSIARVAKEFGNSAGGIGIVIAMAAVIGTCMLDSGAADRIVRAFLRLFGEKRAPVALMGSGFVLAVPVFFDTVFYLLVPLARSLHRKTGKQYLKYILAIGAGGAITHTLVPPTPGPLLMASELGVDLGLMIMIGALVALPAAIVGLLVAGLMDRVMQTPMRQIGTTPDPEPLKDEELPSLILSLLPVLLPVLLISASTILTTLADSEHAALLNLDDIAEEQWPEWRASVVDPANKPGARLLEHGKMTGEAKALFARSDALSSDERQQVVDAVNAVLGDKDFYDETVFFGVVLNPTAKKMLAQRGIRMKKVDAERLNRALLESVYPETLAKHTWDTKWRKASDISKLFGDANLALLISTIIALWILVRQRNISRNEMAKTVEKSLMSGGVIILITAGGGAFGAMLTAAQVGPAIETMFKGQGGAASSGLAFLLLGFLIAAVLKIAQGSSTVAMIVGSGMMAAIVAGQDLGYHPVYLATSIGAGSLIGSWMNDSGFWIFAKMGGLTEAEALKSWTVMLIVLGVVSFAVTVALAIAMPLTSL